MWQTLTLLLACSDATGVDSPADSVPSTDSAVTTGRLDLADPELWVALDAADDPFADHRPDPVDCDPAGLFVETGLFEVDTSLCGYVSAAQTLTADVRVDDTLQVLVYHAALSASEPAEGHVAILIGEHLVWEQTVAIPSGSGVYSSEVGAAFDAPVGTQAVFHLHNHGNNSWNLGHLRRDRAQP